MFSKRSQLIVSMAQAIIQDDQAKGEINKEQGDPLLFDPEDQDDDIQDPDYIPPSEHSDDEDGYKILKENRNILNIEQPKEYVKNTDGDIVVEYVQNISRVNERFALENEEEDFVMQFPEEVPNLANSNLNYENYIRNIIPERDNPIDEDIIGIGNNEVMQKQIRPRTSNERRVFQKKKHPFSTICVCKNKKCVTLISEADRKIIYESFWQMEREPQRIWMTKHIKEVRSKRRAVEGSRRNFSRTYELPKCIDNEDEQVNIKVCQKLFLSTLGYKSTTMVDFLLKALKDEHGTRLPKPRPDQRGRHEPANKKNKNLIKDHIHEYGPKPSHYRREHAPKRRYLPADLTIKSMHADYNSSHPNETVSYEYYRKVLEEQNIGFYDAEADKCTTCMELDSDETEENKSKKEDHLNEVKLRRQLYTEDSMNNDTETLVYAGDMQKVFLLPRMPKVKDCFFTSRMIVFNETFASMKKHKDSTHFCILWYEAMAGRRAEDVSSASIKLLDLNRDALDIIIWLDNCGAQNKNWVLYSSLMLYVNVNSVTLKYLLTGHTYNAADGLNGKIEQRLKKTASVEDMQDFVDVVKNSAAKIDVKLMDISDFYKFENILKSNIRKKNTTADLGGLPYLKDLVEVRFVKGQKEIFFKTKFTQESYNSTQNIVKKKCEFKKPAKLSSMRGLKTSKKEGIMKALVPVMKTSRKNFWIHLPTNDNSEDILEEEGL